MAVMSRLRMELPDHPGALAAVTRALAAENLDIVEVSIHEVEGARAVDEIVVRGTHAHRGELLRAALAHAGAELLSVAPCEARVDPTIAALTWMAATLDDPSTRPDLPRLIAALTGITSARVLPMAAAVQWSAGEAALRHGRPVVRHVDSVPPPLQTADEVGSKWLLAAPDSARSPSVVVFATRPYAVRFTATETARLTAVLDCLHRLSARALAGSS